MSLFHDDTSAPTDNPTFGTQPTLPAPVSPDIGIQPTMASSSDERSHELADYQGLPVLDRGHYVLGRELARGGMGRISIGRDRRLGRVVAIKELVVDSAALRARFAREARITARLEHPAIVSLHEAGRWATGEPFYAMRLVRGESLEHAIAARPTLHQRMELLPNMIAAADALAFAHSERVIHRDLKPSNVLVGTFGETVVIDWGLAKELDAGEERCPAPDAGPFRVSVQPEVTSAGSVMGTPAYMPPEQACGDSVDERADVYSLGAMLYQVLGGIPPYRGQTADEVLEAVLAGPPAPLASRATGIPRDLLAIVDKALARDPHHRYPTARELVADLKRYQTGQLVGAHEYTIWQLVRRWIRRHRAPVAAAVLALVAVTGVGVLSVHRILAEQKITAHQRAIAEKNRGQAEDLIAFMIGNLRERLEPLGKLDLLDVVSSKAMTYYLGRDTVADDTELAKRAAVMLQRSHILQAQEKLDESLMSAVYGLTIMIGLVDRHPDDVELQRQLAHSHERMAYLWRAAGDASAALTHVTAARSIWQTLLSRPGVSANELHGAASIELAYGNLVRARHDGKAALDAYRVARTYIEKWVTLSPSDGRARGSLAAADNSIAQTLFDLGDTAGAIATAREALATLEPLVAADADNASRARNLFVAHLDLGTMLEQSGDLKESIAQLRAGVAIATRLANADPTNVSAQADLAHALATLGETLASTDDLMAAISTLREALATYEAISAMAPTDHEAKTDVASTRVTIGTLLRRYGPPGDALTELERARSLYEEIAQSDPTNDEPQNQLALVDRHRSACLLAMGRKATAVVAAKQALARDEILAARRPEDSRQRDWLNDSLYALAEAQLTAGHKAEALVLYRRAITSRAELAAKDPANAELAERLARDKARLEEIEGVREPRR